MSIISEKRRAQMKAWRLKNAEKMRGYAEKWRAKNPDKPRQACRNYYMNNRERELERGRLKRIKEKQLPNFEEIRQKKIEYNRRYYEKNKEKQCAQRNTPKQKERMKQWKATRLAVPANRIRYILKGIERRATEKGMVFDSALLSIIDNPPVTCACCNTILDYSGPKKSHQSRSPSFDRVQNSYGYAMQNVAVICMRCNFLKSDATLTELKMLVAYVERELKERAEKYGADE